MALEELYPDRFDVSENLGLCCLIVDAAGQIDFKVQGKETKLFKANPVRKLSGILIDFARNLENNPLDVDGYGIISLLETLNKYEANKKIQVTWGLSTKITLHTYELAPKVALVAYELRDIDRLPRERLELLRGFCIKLYDNVSAYDTPIQYYLVA